MKRYCILIGNFGSGKTEISLNIAMDAAKRGKSILVDLDIINPYFRSAERKKDLEEANVELLHPVFALTTVDVPSLPPDVYSVFAKPYDTVVFDVGGDPTGARALGQYKQNFDNLLENETLEVLYVINPRRPFSADASMILDMLAKIEGRARLRVTGLINNGNLSTETTADDLRHAYDIVREVSIETGIEVKYTTSTQKPLKDFLDMVKKENLDPLYIGEPMQIATLMRRDWDRFTELGV